MPCGVQVLAGETKETAALKSPLKSQALRNSDIFIISLYVTWYGKDFALFFGRFGIR